MYHFYIFEIRIRGTTRSTLSDIFERTTSSAKHPHSSVYAHSARLARHAHFPPLSLFNQDQRNDQTTSPNRIPTWILMEKVQDQRNNHITRRLPKQIHYDHILFKISAYTAHPSYFCTLKSITQDQRNIPHLNCISPVAMSARHAH